ncbi:hypothetical protein Tdes44962_MAKER08924 [Teratosphaeria destructans]|uniref:Uncharacterized protein n=1 Tax=Teratosphaeria destructans TaxID=418781 RepID=A0A9W7W3M9_9PEZI|nr:hypothetical protein Tdes44962_MAKER08924 [Teratosphaeria destructans]
MPGPRPPSPMGHEPLQVQVEMLRKQNKWHESHLYERGIITSKEDLADMYAGRGIYKQLREHGRSVAEQLHRKRKASKSPSPVTTPMPQPTEYGKIIVDDPQLASESRSWTLEEWNIFNAGMHERWRKYQQPPQEFVNPKTLSVGTSSAPAAKKPKKGDSSSGNKVESCVGKKGESSGGKKGESSVGEKGESSGGQKGDSSGGQKGESSSGKKG